MIRRRYLPEEFHGLSVAEADEMVAAQLGRAEWERSRLRCAHGDLVAALLHLRRAVAYFDRRHPAVGAALEPLAVQLAVRVPSYAEFSASMVPRREAMTSQNDE